MKALLKTAFTSWPSCLATYITLVLAIAIAVLGFKTR